MISALSGFDLDSLVQEIKKINLMPMSTASSRRDARMLLVSLVWQDNVRSLLSLEYASLSRLLTCTPRLRCWYAPVFSTDKLWELTDCPTWRNPDELFRCGTAFEFYYWGFFNRIQTDHRHLAPFILGISQEVNLLFTILRDDGASVASIVNHSFTGRFNLCLPNIVRIFGQEPPSDFNKFLYCIDTSLYK